MFAQNGLAALQFGDLVLIATNDRRVRSIEDSGKQRLDLLFHRCDLALAGSDDFGGLLAPLLPGNGEHRARHGEQRLRRLEGSHQLADVAFELLARNRLAVAFTRFRLAEVIGIGLVAARAPRGAQGHAAIGANCHAAHDEVVPYVPAKRCFRYALAAFLHLVECVECDQRLVMALEPIDAVGLAADVSSIERMREDVGHALLGDDALPVAREFREALEEALDLRIRLEASVGAAFEGVAHDGRQRLVRFQHLAAPLDFLVMVAGHGVMHPEARLHARFHLLRDLAAVLFPLQFALRSHDGFDELPFGSVFKLEVQTFSLRVAEPHLPLQCEMEYRVTRVALEIVKNDDEIFIGMRVEIGQQGDHAGPLHEVAAATLGIRKDGNDLIALCSSIFAAAMFLTVESVPVFFLRLGGNAAIEK